MERGSEEEREASLLRSLNVDRGRKDSVRCEAMVKTGSRGPQSSEGLKVREQERAGCWAEWSDSCSLWMETKQSLL